MLDRVCSEAVGNPAIEECETVSLLEAYTPVQETVENIACELSPKKWLNNVKGIVSFL